MAGPVQRLYLGDTNEAQAKVANISSGVLQGLERITCPEWKRRSEESLHERLR